MSNAPKHARSYPWWTLAVLSIASLMVVLDATVINIALPRAQESLGFSAANRQWIITSYALAFGSLLLVGGRLSDMWGRRNALYVGLTGFAVASALGGAAHSFAMLVTARAVQGAFGAVLAPAALAALTTTFQDPKERAKAFSIYGAISASGAAIGLILGGALTQWASWRWCLFINLFFAAIALIGVLIFVVPGKSEHHTRLDVLGTLLGSGGLFFVVYGLSHAVASSWSDEITWGSLLIGALFLLLFVGWQRRSKFPLLPLRIVLDRTRGGSLIALFITSIGIFGISLFLAYYLQTTLGYSPLRTGVAFLPLVGAITFSATMASARLLAKVGPRPLVPAGMILGMLGTVLFTRLTAHPDYVGNVLPGLIVTGLGLGLIFAPATASATAAIWPRDAGAASAMVSTTQQIGGSMGTSLLNTIAVSATMGALRHAPVTTNKALSAIVKTHAVLHGYSMAFWWCAGFFGFGAIATFILLESGVPDLEGELVPLL
jgi:EmrB/QacA subfamily drug resistance transporter